MGGSGGVVVTWLLLFERWLADEEVDAISVGELEVPSVCPLVLVPLCEYGGGGGNWRGCCWAAMKAIVLAYDGGSVVGTVGDALPLDRGAGGVVGGD